MDEVKGCGSGLECKLKNVFFSILEELANLLDWCSHQPLNNDFTYMLTRFTLSAF
jgi:hypothetical protein